MRNVSKIPITFSMITAIFPFSASKVFFYTFSQLSPEINVLAAFSLLPVKGRPGLEYTVPGAKLNLGLCTGRKGTEQLCQVSQKATS